MKKTYLSAVAVLVCAALVGGIAGTSFYTKPFQGRHRDWSECDRGI